MRVRHLRCPIRFSQRNQTFRLRLHDWLPYVCTFGAEEQAQDLDVAFCFLCFLPSAFSFLPTAFYLLPSAFLSPKATNPKSRRIKELTNRHFELIATKIGNDFGYSGLGR